MADRTKDSMGSRCGQQSRQVGVAEQYKDSQSINASTLQGDLRVPPHRVVHSHEKPSILATFH